MNGPFQELDDLLDESMSFGKFCLLIIVLAMLAAVLLAWWLG